MIFLLEGESDAASVESDATRSLDASGALGGIQKFCWLRNGDLCKGSICGSDFGPICRNNWQLFGQKSTGC